MLRTATRIQPTTAMVDATLALLLVVFALVESSTAPSPSATGLAIVIGLGAIAIALRSVVPVPALVASMVAIVLATSIDGLIEDLFAPMLAPVLTAYSVGATARFGGYVMAGAAVLAAGITAEQIEGRGYEDIGVFMVVVFVAGLIGVAGREIEFESDVHRRRADELAADRDRRAREAVAAERLRIARELHDVVGHTISVMGVQAGAVRRRLLDHQHEERDVLRSVEEAGRSAVSELHRMLGLLRAAGDEHVLDTPATARAVRDIADELRRAGLDVTLTGEHVVDELPPAAALTVLRIVQEGLTNTLRHAPGARVEVTLARHGDALDVHVLDDGAGHAADPDEDSGEGFGLVGIRERVAVFGGTLHAGPRAPHGFELRARLEVPGT